MFSETVQPPVLSLFSSTNSDALRLFSTHIDASLPADSFIHLLHDATDSPPPTRPACLISPGDQVDTLDSESRSPPDYTLDQTVLHIQSPTLRTTYIHSPPIHPSSSSSSSSTREQFDDSIHAKHPWMHVQVRNLKRDWSLEVGLVDQAGRTGVLRLSTFQKLPRLIITTANHVPLLHLPLAFPHSSSRPLTAWSTLSLNLPYYLQHFKSSFLLSSDDHSRMQTAANLPVGTYSHVSYVRIYATCRLRRIWFADSGPTSNQELPWEFQLYGYESQEH